MVSLSSFVCSFPSVAFSGSRVGSSSASVSCRAFLPVLGGFSGSVGVGCASGVDSFVRSAFPSACVFSVSSFLVGGHVCRSSFALRSSALVSWCASSGGLLVAFPLGACPSSVRVSSSFGGFGSGSWGSVALAVGFFLLVLVFLLLCRFLLALPLWALLHVAVRCGFQFLHLFSFHFFSFPFSAVADYWIFKVYFPWIAKKHYSEIVF